MGKHEKCTNLGKKCECDCHAPILQEKRDKDLLAKFNIRLHDYCPKCEITHLFEYDNCPNCGKILIKMKRFVSPFENQHSTAKIEKMMKEREKQERKEKEEEWKRHEKIYLQGKLRACFDYEQSSFLQRLGKHETQGEYMERIGMHKLREHFLMIWSPWDRKWK